MTHSYDEVHRLPEGEDPDPRALRPHDCEHCGKHMEYADQQCACSCRSNRIGYQG